MDPKLSVLIRRFEKACEDRATTSSSNEAYEQERANVLAQPELLTHLPAWVTKCRTGAQFWDLMKTTSPQWAPRRAFICNSLNPVHDWIENRASAVHESVASMLEVVSSETISAAWLKILSRKGTDPTGTITAARSMVESTCKHILDELLTHYENDCDLPKLYKLTARSLKLGVDQHDEQVFKQILTACGSAVDGLASLRNKHGDAHGPGKKALRPSARHADLAANMAGTMCTFLIATLEARRADPNSKAPPSSS